MVGAQTQTEPRTGAELANWERRTSPEEVLSFLSEVQALTDHMLVRRIGESAEGRPIAAVFLGEPVLAAPEALSRSEKPVLLITGSIHGDEPAGAEGALQLIRELALGESQRYLSAVHVIIVPQMNPDGSVADTRENAGGYDLNRDWVTAETPEVRAVLSELVVRYWPDVFLDLHNGGAFPYHLTYQATLEPAADEDLVALARGPMYASVERRLEANGMQMFWYSGPAFDERQEEWYWRTTEPLPRKQHSYGGLQDMIALLFEAPEAHPAFLAAAAIREGTMGLIQFLADNPAEVRARVRQARERTVNGPPSEVYLELQSSSHPGRASFYVVPPATEGEVAAPELVEGENRTLYVPTRSRSVPWGYAFDGRIEELSTALRMHGIQVERLQRPITVPVEKYAIGEIVRARDRYQQHLLTDVRVRVERGFEILPTGTYLVRVRQPAGRLIPQLLEPDAVDSFVRWNFLDSHLPMPGNDSYLPLFRLGGRPAIPTTLLP